MTLLFSDISKLSPLCLPTTVSNNHRINLRWDSLFQDKLIKLKTYIVLLHQKDLVVFHDIEIFKDIWPPCTWVCYLWTMLHVNLTCLFFSGMFLSVFNIWAGKEVVIMKDKQPLYFLILAKWMAHAMAYKNSLQESQLIDLSVHAKCLFLSLSDWHLLPSIWVCLLSISRFHQIIVLL